MWQRLHSAKINKSMVTSPEELVIIIVGLIRATPHPQDGEHLALHVALDIGGDLA
jgi:hypothetical protein